MQTKFLKYLLVEPLPVLRDGFYHGIKILNDGHPYYSLIGTEMSSYEADEALKKEDSQGYQLIWMHLNPNKPKMGNPLKLLAAWQQNRPELGLMVSLQQATIYLLREIFQKINPRGILELIDCDQLTIDAALLAMLQEEVFYSKTILALLQTYVSTIEALDGADFTILHELDKGTPITQLPEKVLLSHSSILNRRTKLKELFGMEGKTDAELVQEVKRLGYI